MTTIRAIQIFRIGYGAILCIGALRFMAEGWIDPFFVEPGFFFKYPGFAWIAPLTRTGMYAVYSAIAVLAFLVAIGRLYRFSIVALTLLFAYAQLCDVTNYLNHYYLVVLIGVWLSVIPAHTPDKVPPWAIHVLRFQFAVVYFYAGLAKLTHDWLIDAQPLTTWFHARDDLPVIGPLLALKWAPLVASWAAFFYDTTIPLWLSLKRTRPFAFAAVLGFHSLTAVFFDIGLFPWIMTLGATLFFAPWPRVELRRPLRWAFAAYACLQIVIPLRHFAYGGNVLWDEAGMRFSWKVMVREKNGSVTYLVASPSRGRRVYVSPHDYLTWRQANEMSGQPDLIAQLARHIGEDYKTRGWDDVEVRVDARVSLNGRQPRVLIDPTIDLLRTNEVPVVALR